MRPEGRAIELPRALSPRPLEGRVCCAPAVVDVAANVSPPGPKTLRPTGAIAEVDPWTGRLLRERAAFEAPEQAIAPPWPVIVGIDAARRLIVISPERSLLLLDTETLAVIARHRPRLPLGPMVYAAPNRLLYAGSPTERPVLEMISWS